MHCTGTRQTQMRPWRGSRLSASFSSPMMGVRFAARAGATLSDSVSRRQCLWVCAGALDEDGLQKEHEVLITVQRRLMRLVQLHTYDGNILHQTIETANIIILTDVRNAEPVRAAIDAFFGALAVHDDENVLTPLCKCLTSATPYGPSRLLACVACVSVCLSIGWLTRGRRQTVLRRLHARAAPTA
jgi:hypothetical protein